VLTRKSLGGLHTDLSSRVLGASGQPVPGLYAAGEAAGFGGGGMHGYRSLEGTFLGGCLFSGRIAGRAAAAAVALSDRRSSVVVGRRPRARSETLSSSDNSNKRPLVPKDHGNFFLGVNNSCYAHEKSSI
jgi:succinate dehydrogenase/fumarate reductase flavoprotein subunit